jgi:transcriptional regulator with XRE-family HTH domain
MFCLLEEKSLRAADLCRYLGINTSTMTNWKNRDTDPPAKFIAPICEFLNVSYEYLLTGTDSGSGFELDANDRELLELFHQLPERKQQRLIGYVERMVEETAVGLPSADPSSFQKTGTDPRP